MAYMNRVMLGGLGGGGGAQGVGYTGASDSNGAICHVGYTGYPNAASNEISVEDFDEVTIYLHLVELPSVLGANEEVTVYKDGVSIKTFYWENTQQIDLLTPQLLIDREIVTAGSIITIGSPSTTSSHFWRYSGYVNQHRRTPPAVDTSGTDKGWLLTGETMQKSGDTSAPFDGSWNLSLNLDKSDMDSETFSILLKTLTVLRYGATGVSGALHSYMVGGLRPSNNGQAKTMEDVIEKFVHSTEVTTKVTFASGFTNNHAGRGSMSNDTFGIWMGGCPTTITTNIFQTAPSSSKIDEITFADNSLSAGLISINHNTRAMACWNGASDGIYGWCNYGASAINAYTSIATTAARYTYADNTVTNDHVSLGTGLSYCGSGVYSATHGYLLNAAATGINASTNTNALEFSSGTVANLYDSLDGGGENIDARRMTGDINNATKSLQCGGGYGHTVTAASFGVCSAIVSGFDFSVEAKYWVSHSLSKATNRPGVMES